MIPVPSGVRVWLATGNCDMRKGYASLSVLVQETLKHDPHGGHLFVFRGRRGDRIKIISSADACVGSRRNRCNAKDFRVGQQTALSMGNKLREQKGWNSLNQLISPCDEERRHFETKRFGGLEIDHQLELGRLLDREVAWLRAFEDFVHVGSGLPVGIENARPVRHETPGLHILPDAVCCR